MLVHCQNAKRFLAWFCCLRCFHSGYFHIVFLEVVSQFEILMAADCLAWEQHVLSKKSNADNNREYKRQTKEAIVRNYLDVVYWFSLSSFCGYWPPHLAKDVNDYCIIRNRRIFSFRAVFSTFDLFLFSRFSFYFLSQTYLSYLIGL